MLSKEVKRSKLFGLPQYFVLLLSVLNAIPAEEPGRVDPSFDAFTSNTPQYVPGISVAAIAEQPDGKVVFAGNFRVTAPSYDQSYIVRALPNGDIDLDFRVTVNGSVFEIAVHSDGSIIIIGSFSTVNGQPRRRIARLDGYGGLDAVFDPNSVPLDRVENIYRCTDGTTVAKAWLTNTLGGITKHIVRFNHLGTLDPTFDVTVEPSYHTYPWSTEQYESLWRLVAATPRSWGNPPGADDRFYIVGGFTSVNGISRTNLARLLPEGIVDASFDSGTFPISDSSYLSPEHDLAVQPDGRVVVWNGTNIARLNMDGSIDHTFNAGTGLVHGGGPLNVQADGRILVRAAAPEGIPRSKFWRLNADGTFDWSFHAGTGPTNTFSQISDIRVVTPLSDHKIMVGGSFNGVDGSWRLLIARLYGGELPPEPPKILLHPLSLALLEFQPMALFSDVISFEQPSIKWRKDGIPLPDGTNLSISAESVSPAYAGEYTVVFSNSVGMVTSAVAHVTVEPPVTGPGSLDLQYAGGTRAGEFVLKITIDRDDRALVSVRENYGDTRPVRRLNHNGSIDSSFRLGQITSGDGVYVYSVLLTPSDGIQIGGFFKSIEGVERRNLARLGPDGELDTSFVMPSPGVSHFVYDSVLDLDGKTVVVGSFDKVNGISRGALARINPDGFLDSSFNSANAFSNRTFGSIHRLPAGKYLLDATTRLNPNGTIDDLFDAGGIAGRVNTSVPLPNGDILIAGSFTHVSNLPRNLIARLRALDGSVDASFSSPPLYCLPEGGIYGMALQPDGKIVVAGRFGIGIDAAVSNLVARLNSDGTIDTAFTPAQVRGGAYSWSTPRVDKLAIQSDGSILVGGDFTLVNGYSRTNLARLNGDRVITPSTPTAQTGTATNITFLSAMLSGWANPHDAATRVYFEFGTTTNYGRVTPLSKLPAGTNDVDVTLNVSNVLADTTYHYRFVATNRTGVAFGEDREFTTPPRPPEPRMSNPARLGNGSIEFTFLGDPERIYAVMVSTNLINWSEAGTAMEVSTGTFKFSDGQTSSPPTKFYRLRTP